MRIKRSDRQTIFDIAIQYSGDVEAAFEIARINDISLNDLTIMELEVPPAYNNRVAEYYQINSINPATSASSDNSDANITSSTGDLFMTINDNQIITIING
ncbi:MAG: hypothetical protein LBU51_10220 [Bacteroidales bacterium]|jgi:hypothetical protein|nr:hypothetical protein [Bacteroidales bacterium]